MPLIFDEETQEYVYEAPAGSVAAQQSTDVPLDYTDRLNQQISQNQQSKSELEQQKVIEAIQGKGGSDRPNFDDKPLFGDVGMLTRDFLRTAGNAGASLVTDYVDVGHGLVDLAGQTANAAMGRGFNGDEVFNDADNPLTNFRMETLDLASHNAETKVGEITNQIARVGVAILTLPKTFLKGAALPFKAIGSVKGLGKVKNISKALDRAQDSYNAGKGLRGKAKIPDALEDIRKTANAPGPIGTAMRAAKEDDWLFLTYKDIVNSGVPEATGLGRIMRSTERAARNLTRGKASVKTVGEALAWDAFVAFNVAGEGTGLDENFSDALKSMGLPHISGLTTNVADTPLELKIKGLIDSSILGGAMSALFDFARIQRFSKAFSKADDADKAKLVELFNGEANKLGKSVADVEEITAGLARVDQPMPAPSSIPMGSDNLLDLYARQVDGARVQNRLNLETQQQLLNQQIIRGGTADEIAGESMALANQSIDTVGSPLNRLSRPLEPTVTGNNFRRAFAAELERITKNKLGFAMERGNIPLEGFNQETIEATTAKALRLMPETRVDMINYFSQFPMQFNEVGTMDAAASLQNNFVIQTGLREGWMTVNADMMLMYNRKVAFDFDRGTIYVKQAAALDEAAEIQRYDDAIDVQFEDVTDPKTQPAQNALDPASGPVDPDALVSNPNLIDTAQQPRTALEDQALVEARRQEEFAAVEGKAAENTEETEILAQAAADYRAEVGDAQIIEEMLGQNPEQLGELTIEKVGNRQYQVLTETGESIDGNTYVTLKSARKGKEIADKKRLQDTVAKARALSDNNTNQIVPMSFAESVGTANYPSSVRGALSFTKRQLQELTNYGFESTGTKFDLTQAEMFGMRKAIDSLLETAVGSQKTVLKTMRAKLDVAITELDPAVRMAREVDRTLESGKKLLDNGEICF